MVDPLARSARRSIENGRIVKASRLGQPGENFRPPKLEGEEIGGN